MKNITIKNNCIEITDKNIAIQCDAIQVSPNKPYILPYTLGAIRELYKITKDKELLELGKKLSNENKELIALKEEQEAKIKYFDYTHIDKKRNEVVNLTEKQYVDIYFGIEVLKSQSTLFYFDSPRTGKTPKAIATSDALKAKKIIVANLKNVLNQFKDEYEVWQKQDRKVIVINGQDIKVRQEIWKEFFSSDESIVLISTYETIKNDENYWLNKKFDLLIADEPHKKIKNYYSGNYKSLKTLSKLATHKILLTGTPLANLMEEVYVYLSIAFPNTFKNRQSFLYRYFELEKNSYGSGYDNKVIAYKREKELQEIIAPMATNRQNEQWRPNIKYIDIPLSQRQRELINFIKENGELELDKQITITKKDKKFITKYRALEGEIVINGFIRRTLVADYANEGIEAKEASNKLKYIIYYIKNNPKERILVFTDHTYFIKQSEKFLKGINYKISIGSTSVKDREHIKNEFNKGNIQMVIGNIQTLSTGGTFNKATKIFFLNLPWTPAELRQAQDRLLDFKDENNVGKEVFVLRHPNTEDEDMEQMLDIKKENQEPINNFERNIKC